MNTHKHSQASINEVSTLNIIKRCFAFTLIFSFLSLILLLLSSAILIRLEDPTRWSNTVGKIVLYVSALFSSLFLSKKNRQAYIFSGAIFGAIITLLIFVLSLIYPNSLINELYFLK